MKILGLSCGSKLGNSEILLKEALMGAGEVKGVETEYIRIHDLDIKPCRRCKRCFQREGGECIVKDDSLFVTEKYLQCDGFIISSPVYGTIPPGELLVLAERAFGARSDVAGFLERKKMGGKSAEGIDERVFKPRAGALIGVGGASSYEWVHLTMPLLHNIMLPMQVALVDHLQVRKASFAGTVLLQDTAMSKARQLGQRVASALGKPFDEVKWQGDDKGVCPICHSSLFVLDKKGPAMCAICGIYGELSVQDGKTSVHFTAVEKKKSRVAIEGKRIHLQEIMRVGNELQKRMGEITPKLEKYKKFKEPVKPPRKK